MKKEKEIVSVCVLMSTYNGERYLERQIETILNQEECRIILLVRDDGSSDKTLDILKKYQEQGRLSYYSGKNVGPTNSFLDLLDNAPEADYYAFSDQDDIWLPDKMSRAIKKLKETKLKGQKGLYFSNLTPVDEKEDIIKEFLLPEVLPIDYYTLMIRCGWMFGCTEVFTKELKEFVKKQYRPQKIVMHDLWMGLLASTYGTIVYDSTSKILYRQHQNNVVGAQLNGIQRWKKRLDLLVKGNRVPIDCRAKAMLRIFRDNPDVSKELQEQTWIVANYNKSLKTRIGFLKYAQLFDEKAKRALLRAVLIVLGKE
jgi:glycosyltransferase involved in cell wall biosynthesis